MKHFCFDAFLWLMNKSRGAGLGFVSHFYPRQIVCEKNYFVLWQFRFSHFLLVNRIDICAPISLTGCQKSSPWKRGAMFFQVVVIVKQLPFLHWELWRCCKPTLRRKEEKQCQFLPFPGWSRDILWRLLEKKKPVIHIILSGLNLWLFKSKMKTRIWQSRFESHFNIIL